MSTTAPSQLPTVSELVQLLQTAFHLPGHWQTHVSNLGLCPGRELPPEELTRVTEQVFWMVRQMGIKDPAAWLANRRRSDASTAAVPTKSEISPNFDDDNTAQGAPREVDASQRRPDVAKACDASVPTSANEVEPATPRERGYCGSISVQ